jgi:hypothetical protein
MIKRYGALLAVAAAVFFTAGDALACRSFLGNPDANTDVTTYKNDLNVDLADYGVIYDEAAPWSGCTQAAADALYKKLYTTFNPSVVGKPAFPRTSAQINGSFYQFQGWLGGGDVALIQATALRLANIGKLSKPLDDLVQRVSNIYVFNVDQNCGFDGTVPKHLHHPLDHTEQLHGGLHDRRDGSGLDRRLPLQARPRQLHDAGQCRPRGHHERALDGQQHLRVEQEQQGHHGAGARPLHGEHEPAALQP